MRLHVERKMATSAWNPNFSVKVKRCDEDHKKLFLLIEDLNEAMRSGQGNLVVDGIVQDLQHYAQIHFTAEEALMVKAKYPGLAAHQVEHRKFIQSVAEFRRDLNNGANGQSISVSMFMNNWLVNHIMGTDKQYSAHLNANGIC
jgi:hemerythrin-like metal-binding protein